jgi:hypothetical protein
MMQHLVDQMVMVLLVVQVVQLKEEEVIQVDQVILHQ